MTYHRGDDGNNYPVQTSYPHDRGWYMPTGIMVGSPITNKDIKELRDAVARTRRTRMKVSDLIEKLKEQDGDAEVVIEDERGYSNWRSSINEMYPSHQTDGIATDSPRTYAVLVLARGAEGL